MTVDFNKAAEQRSIEVIPAGTICTLQMKVRPGGAGDGRWLKNAKSGESYALDCEFTVVEGPFAKRKLWQLYTLGGKGNNHAQAGEISERALRAILESARGFKFSDNSEAAQAARTVASYAEFNGLCFMAKLGVRPPEGAFAAKNFIAEVITPEKSCWKQPTQIPMQDAANGNGAAPTTGSGVAQPANPIARPEWANPTSPPNAAPKAE